MVLQEKEKKKKEKRISGMETILYGLLYGY